MAMQSVQQMLAADGVADIVDFSYIPFGNEFYNPIKECPPGDTSYSHDGCQCWMNACNGTTPAMDCFAGTPVCQHGPDECAANRIEACAIYAAGGAKAPDVWTKFIFCFEVDNNSNAASAQDCAKKAGVDWTKLNACIQPGNIGDMVYKANAMKTLRLEPQHYFTPWFVMNNKPLMSNWQPLLQNVCNAYTGPKPAGCSSPAVDLL